MDQSVTRRKFVQKVGMAGAALAALPAWADWAASAEPRETITLALVGGAHSHTPGYVKRLKDAKNVKVKYVWDPDAKRAEKWATALGATVASDDAVVWSDPLVQAVVICSETNLHHRLVLASAKAHKHLFVEKPMGVTGS